MAAPTLVGTAQWDTGGASPAAHKALMPAGIQAGDEIWVFYVKQGATGTGTPDAKWTTVSTVGLAGGYGSSVFKAIAAGTESGLTLDLTTVAGNRGGSITIVLRGTTKSNAPFVSAWDQPGTNTASANPPSVAPGLGTQDFYLLVFSVQNIAGATWTLPTNYANRLNDPGSGVGGVSYALGRRTASVSSEDPAAASWSSSANTPAAITVAIPGRPITAAQAGAMTPAGGLSRKIKLAGLAGAMTPAGALAQLRKALLAAAGAMTPAGALTRKARTSYAGAMTPAGALTRKARLLTLGGSITPAAAIVYKIKLALAGGITPAGALSRGRKLYLSIGGAITPSGLLTLARRLFTGPPSLAQVLRGHHRPTARALILAADLETVLHEIPGRLVAGSMSDDRTRDVAKQGGLTLANDAGVYSPIDSSSLIWANRIVRLERGAIIQGRAAYEPLMTGIIQRPKETTATSLVTFQIASRLQLAARPFPGPLSLAAGTRVSAAVRAILELGGLGSSDAFYDLEDAGATLAVARSYDGDSGTMLQNAVRLAYDAGLDLYDTGAGTTTMRPWVDPTTTTPFWTFSPGIDSTLVDLGRELQEDAEAINRAIVVGSGPDRYPIRAEARVTNPADPLFWTPENDRPKTYKSPDITSQQMANAVAARILFEGATYTEAIDVIAAENPLIHARHVVRLVGRNVDDIYLLDAVDHTAGPGQMRLRSRKIRSLVA